VNIRAVRLRHDYANMIAPQIQRGAFLGGIGRAVIDARDTSLMAANVIQYGFGDVRLDAIGNGDCTAKCPLLTQSGHSKNVA